jgi:putative membrane protein
MRSAVLVAAVGVAYAAGCSSAPQSGPSAQESVVQRAAATAEAPAGEGAAPSLSDAEIAAIVVTANTIDAELGELADRRGTSGSVREFGRTMARDHRAVNASAVALVTKLGVMPAENDVSRQLRADADTFRAQLEKLTGAAFDSSYIEHEVSYHRAVVDAVDRLLIPSATSEELRKTLTDVRPALLAHLQHAEHLQSSLKQAR